MAEHSQKFTFSWRSHSAPPRKKWYRRGPSLLTRQRSTRQEEEENSALKSMLYDQMVSRRLVGAIAAWHDLHASLLQLSLNNAEHQQQQRQCAITDDSSASSDAFVRPGSSRTDTKRRSREGRRVSGRTQKGSGRRQRCSGECGLGRVHQHVVDGEDEYGGVWIGEERALDSGTEGGAAAANLTTPTVTDAVPSRSSSLASGSSSAEGQRRQMMDRPDIDEAGSSCSTLNWPAMGGRPSPAPSSATIGASRRAHPKVAGHASLGGDAFGSGKAATWSATFAQSLRIRPASSRRRARSPVPRARSPKPPPSREIVIKHSVQLVQPATVIPQQQQPKRSRHPLMQQTSMLPALLSLARQNTCETPASQRRCFSVAKVNDHHGSDCRWHRGDSVDVSSGSELSDDDDDCWADLMEDGDEPVSGCSSGALSESELDVLYEQERNRPKLSISSPELTPDQLKQLFPELSDHWRCVQFLAGFGKKFSLYFSFILFSLSLFLKFC